MIMRLYDDDDDNDTDDDEETICCYDIIFDLCYVHLI